MIDRILPGAAIGLLCMACSGAPGTSPGQAARQDAAVPQDSPAASATGEGAAFAAELMIERLAAGENHALNEYQLARETCAAAGWPIRPLSPEQAGLLGKRRVEVAMDGNRRLLRATEWRMQSPADEIGTLCLFTFHESVHEYYDGPDRSVYSAHEDGKVQRQQQPPQPILADADAGTAAGEEIALAEAMGWQRDGAGSFAGQPCSWWRQPAAPGLRICMWNAAGLPGFSQLPSDVCNADVGVFGDRLPLAQEPGDGASCRIETVRLVTGTQVPASAFSLKP